MRRKKLVPLIFIVLLSLGSFAAVLATGTSPALGLDLQGGVSVVLQPVNQASDDALDQTIEIIRNRVDSLGVAEPEIARQGGSIIVQLPGVEDQERALELVGATAELRFRPVLSSIPGSIDALLEESSSTTATTAPTDPEATTTVPPDGSTTTAPPVEGQSASGMATPFQDDPTATTVAPDPTATTVPTGVVDPTPEAPTTGLEVTPRDDDVAEQPVVLEEYIDGDPDRVAFTYQLGPSLATGRIVSSAQATLETTGQWTVRLEFRGGADGIDLFNSIAAKCNTRGPECPSGQLAIVLDSVVQSAPTISQPSYARDQVQITGQFGEREAKDLALVLRYGALPVNLEPQTVQTVSATLGEDSLQAGLVAGLVGLAAVCIYMLLYYRALGLVVILGLGLWSALNYAIIAWLGETQGLALSLAGVTGIVISVGVTVDSYVVYFERLKDDLRGGRTLRSSTERSFKQAWRTIFAANFTSFIGAALLYLLTVGPVRGFAFFLGLATVLDIVVAWFFTRPVVSLLANSRWFTGDQWYGLTRGLSGRDRTPAPAIAPSGGGR